MHGIRLFTNVALVASLVLGVSGLVMNPVNDAPHRRHAAAVANIARGSEMTPVPVQLMPKRSIAERRALRQKRCLQRLTDSTTVSSSSPVADDTNAPANVAPAPTPDSTTSTTVNQQQVQPQPQPQPQPTPDPPSNSGADTFSGQLTFYDVGLGSCGRTNSNSDMIAAASMLLYDGFEGYAAANPNNNPICGRRAAVTYQGKTITVEIVDRCVGCAKYDLDLAPAAFSLLADQGLGRLDGMTWHFV